ncbi:MULTISPECIES: Fe-S cluster assembly scaffold SufA [Lonsdalea]|uniref:Fe-S cluster assembly scaffold SufA n=2 Tax=Lonsdalea TaxID=1082702 RepID=A0ACD1JGW1_9GAMM|nr:MULTISPECIES: Fe-S cluster assembly scaffold SufA [Lonsdalea]OSM99486.1 Fe-S cluster assembly scaffold SufA [Lonsdalea populi]OSN02745.1 Fe-S cluster assembly scaffold SufA [Lonsdalea populi]QPQ25492.1 Fe-S cluster assembly scaffold SufA [Lonsdalea populi]RAT15587.1 Fe-S cluster assembly scaffold SufA [Lonsdalea quercina]RAT18227.1 Fe-S cluster assembly scaffold SufA [Lonsdalea quercina]
MQSQNVETFSLDENVWQGLTLTESAAAHIVRLMQQDPGVQGLRLSVKQSGCAGFGYVLDMVKQPDADEQVFQRDGARLYVPLKAMPFIDGTEVDYVHEGLNQVFKFNNPKAQHACGCGESFGL